MLTHIDSPDEAEEYTIMEPTDESEKLTTHVSVLLMCVLCYASCHQHGHVHDCKVFAILTNIPDMFYYLSTSKLLRVFIL